MDIGTIIREVEVAPARDEPFDPGQLPVEPAPETVPDFAPEPVREPVAPAGVPAD
jgi:hypothetical protein